MTSTAQAIDEVIGAALCRLERLLEGRVVETHMADGVPLAFFDPVLLEQVVINLVENAVRYAGPTSPIENLRMVRRRDNRRRGCRPRTGRSTGDEERVFEKLYRVAGAPQGDRGDRSGPHNLPRNRGGWPSQSMAEEPTPGAAPRSPPRCLSRRPRVLRSRPRTS